MKKVLALLLAVICLCSLFSCASKDMDEMTNEFANAVGKRATANISMVIVEEDEEEGVPAKVITSESEFYEKTGEDKKNSLVVKLFTPMTFDNYGNAIIPEGDTTELTAERNEDVERIELTSLTFKTKYFANYSMSATRFLATVDNPDAFFGVDMPTDEVSFDVLRGPYGPREIKISYTTTSGFDVEINIEYKYED